MSDQSRFTLSILAAESYPVFFWIWMGTARSRL